MLFGLVVAVVLLGSVVFFPIAALLIWVIAVTMSSDSSHRSEAAPQPEGFLLGNLPPSTLYLCPACRIMVPAELLEAVHEG